MQIKFILYIYTYLYILFLKFFLLLKRQVNITWYIPREMFSYWSNVKKNFESIANLVKYKYEWKGFKILEFFQWKKKKKFRNSYHYFEARKTTKEAIVSTARRLYIQRGHNFQKGGKVRSFCRAISSRGKQRHFRGNGRLSKFRIPSRLRQRSNTSLNSSLSLSLSARFISPLAIPPCLYIHQLIDLTTYSF